MAIARIRTPDEPPTAAWNYQGVDYMGFCSWHPQLTLSDPSCQECTTLDRGPVDPQDPTAWPDEDDEDDPDWVPDQSSEYDPLEYDSGWETESTESNHGSGTLSDESDGEFDSHDSEDKYPLRDIFAPELPGRLPNGTWYTGFGGGFHKQYAYYAGNRQYPQIWPLSNTGSSNVPPEHIASSSCQTTQGINGHVLSVAQMKNCRNIRFLVPKPADWKGDASDQLLEGNKSTLFYLSGESSGSHMNESNQFRGIHSVYPLRHGLKEIGTSWPYIDEGCYGYDNLLTPLPVHSYCLDLYAKCSVRRSGHVDLNGLWHWREMVSDPESYGLAGRIPPLRPELKRARNGWDYPWLHFPGSEWLVANPVEVPGVSNALKTCMNGPDFGECQRTDSGFLGLPIEIIQHALSFLEAADIDTMARTCRALYKLTQPVFRESIERDMPWLWEVLEGSEYPPSRDRLPTWDPLCPLGIAPPTLPVGLETEEDEDVRWTRIILEDSEMEHVSNIAKAFNRQRRKAIVAPYHARLKALLDEWHDFRQRVETWISTNGQNDRREMNWRRLWLLFNPDGSPFAGIRNRSRIWDACEEILDTVTLAHETGHIVERHEELLAKIPEVEEQTSHMLDHTSPDVPSWLLL